MTDLIATLLAARVPDLVGTDPRALSVLKYSTPTSGKNREDKVIFLVFRGVEAVPCACVKTVRASTHPHMLVQGFKNLETLNALVAGTDHESLFPRALFYDESSLLSVETACGGRRVELPQDMERIVRAYTAFAAHAARASQRNPVSLLEYAREAFAASALPEGEQEALASFLRAMGGETIVLPHLVQHGDVTEDNLLMTDAGPCLLDSDFVGTVNVPGFDLFGLWYRHDALRTAELSQAYLPEYFTQIGAPVQPDQYRALFFLYYSIERTLRKPYLATRARELIAEFNAVFP